MKKNLKKVALVMGLGLVLTGVSGQKSASAYTGMPRGIVANKEVDKQYYTGMPRGTKSNDSDKKYYTGYPRGEKEKEVAGGTRG